jgi:hypothetical protein
MNASANLNIDLQCPSCRRSIKRSFRSLGAGTSLRCSCGTVIRIQGNGFTSAQRSMDQLNREFQRLNRALGR